MQPIATTNYLPKINADECVSCGKCAKVCPIEAISMRENAPMETPVSGTAGETGSSRAATASTDHASDCEKEADPSLSPVSRQKKRPVIDESISLGCGVCARNCPKKAISLQRRPIEVITPVNSTHRFVLQAIEKGTLQNLVFDNQAFANHRARAAVFGTILKLPPLKQALASKQFKSVYLDHLLSAQRKEKQ